MTLKAQRKVIAEACGFIPNTFHMQGNISGWAASNVFAYREAGGATIRVPDYLNDLNAMHGAVKTLTPDQKHEMNRWLLATRPGNLTRFKWEAEADEFAEAFLRTIGQWVEETESQPCA